MTCPWCGLKAVDITTCDQERKRYMCVGNLTHEWGEGDIPDPDESPEEDQPEVSEDAIADRLANRVVEKLQQANPSRSSLMKRLFG